MEWVLLAVVALVCWLLYEGWSTMVAYLQFMVVGVGAGLLAFGILAAYVRHTLWRDRLHALGAALPGSHLHVVALTPPRAVVQDGGAERLLSWSRAEATMLLAVATTIMSWVAYVVAIQSLDIAYVRFDVQRVVEPAWAILYVVAGAVLTVRSLLRRFDP